MQLVSVVGTRPQFVKLAAVHRAIVAAGHDHVVIHTGQHHDSLLSSDFCDDLGLPRPDVNLGVGSSSASVQLAQMIARLEAPITEASPDVVVNYGDTNSALAGALSASRLQVPSVHVEAGLRSFDRSMPEETNRIVVDHLSELCLAPTETAMEHLDREGLAHRSVLVGDVMTDHLAYTLGRLDASDTPNCIPDEDFLLATLHRPANTDDPVRLAAIIGALAAAPLPVLLPAHPRLIDRAATAGVQLATGSIRLVSPLTYRQLIATLQRARGVITDSGGLPKEARYLGVPCTSVRESTEWPETLAHGANVLCPYPEQLVATALRTVDLEPIAVSETAARSVTSAILERLGVS